MALGSALVDRARVKRNVATDEKKEGTKVREPDWSPYFRCRLELPEQSESLRGGRRHRQTNPTLLVGKRDLTGADVDINGIDEVEVVSQQLGTALWEVKGDPKPLRRKRTVIGWELTMTKVGA